VGIYREEAAMVLVRCAVCDDYLGEDVDPLLAVDIENHMRLLHPDSPRLTAAEIADAPVEVRD
jgi:hypothetical protein